MGARKPNAKVKLLIAVFRKYHIFIIFTFLSDPRLTRLQQLSPFFQAFPGLAAQHSSTGQPAPNKGKKTSEKTAVQSDEEEMDVPQNYSQSGKLAHLTLLLKFNCINDIYSITTTDNVV